MQKEEDDDLVAALAEDSGDESKKKKKKRSKKKNASEVEAVADEPVEEEPAAVEVEAAEQGDEAEDDEEADGIADGAGSGKKKRRNKKKKGNATNASTEAPSSTVEQASFAPPPRENATTKEEAEGADDSEEEGEGAAVEGATAKKKKKKKKKPAGGAAIVEIENNGKGVPKYIPDDEWVKWVSNALEATKNGSEKQTPEELMKPPRPFWGYSYSGSLRPAFVTPQMKMPQGFLMPDYATHSEGVSQCERDGPKEVPVLEGQDLQAMREACRYGREVLDIAARYLKEGVTGDEIDRVVYQACVDRKIYPSPLNYFRFPKSVCVSPNEVICHGIPDCRPIQNGDIVNLDVSIYHNGFHADLNETFFIGDCDEEAQRVVRTAYCALLAASKLIRPGTLYRDLGSVIQAEAVKNNCAVVTTYCGHGVGKLFHGPPRIPHYKKNKAVGLMKPGHVFTVEPMINLGGNGGDKTWPDNWTAVTKDGKRSAQFEHTFIVTETGVELLTNRHGTNPSFMPEYDPAMFQR